MATPLYIMMRMELYSLTQQSVLGILEEKSYLQNEIIFF